MKFVALVSGGKDSCFNILHCLNAGHELVAMANLHPKANRPDEIDSWMFQTVGHRAVELLAKCSGVPLFRSEISEDEDAVVNELIELFSTIRAQVEFEGVSVGAIASTYQQLRVDRACAQLNLRSLTYLWQREQCELLQEINRSGMDVRVIKVAGQGLGKQHLGQHLAAIEDDLLEKHDSFGLHPCGEGGEYETMVFDAPFFDKYRMVMVNERTVQHSTDDVYFLEFDVSIEEKPSSSGVQIVIPPLLEPKFHSLAGKTSVLKGISSHFHMVNSQKNLPASPSEILCATFRGSFVSCFEKIGRFFDNIPGGLRLAFHVVVILKDMSKFAEMNSLYSALFSKAVQNLSDGVAPSRACIQAAIPCDIELTTFYGAKIDQSGKGVHVQGLSYWAPASIGPYSQCRLVNGISYVAGQIGLIPQSLQLESDRTVQMVLALQNAARVLDVIHEHANNWGPRLAIAWITDVSHLELVQNIWCQYDKNLSGKARIPLITALIKTLPRHALFEWSLQACDTRYFAWYIPENDDEDALYSPTPELLDLSSSGYVHRAGFQTLTVSTGPVENPHMLISSSPESPSDAMTGNWTPAESVFYDGMKVDSLYIKM